MRKVQWVIFGTVRSGHKGNYLVTGDCFKAFQFKRDLKMTTILLDWKNKWIIVSEYILCETRGP